ncbi:hypothetical protein CPter91_1842 [Collimonas pratensis]|uniref:Uncharacterized protein n=1 Tax=Collimonas pratensis TaxID=279113 RepID=A0A127Q316_9BURK|nr:hypothetical protein CPter91_1842 [Collimonas pratensis]
MFLADFIPAQFANAFAARQHRPFSALLLAGAYGNPLRNLFQAMPQ